MTSFSFSSARSALSHSTIKRFFRTGLLAGLLLGSVPACAQPLLRIAVASNFAEASEHIVAGFEQLNAVTVQISSGSTGKLYAQIRHGAPYDIFLAADAARPQRLEAEGETVPGTRITYAVGRLALWSRLGRRDGEACRDTIRQGPQKTLAVANPALAPYGLASEQALGQMNLIQGNEPRRVVGENIARTWHFVASGAADMGLVALSQVLSVDRAELDGCIWIVPAQLHDPIAQQGVILNDSPRARAFMQWLQSKETTTRLQDMGYAPPRETP